MGIQRKKQYPDLAYRTSEVIGTDQSTHSKDTVDFRARSEERGLAASSKSGPRSRSAEPGVGHQSQKTVMIQSYPPTVHVRSALESKMEEVPEGVQENTEYRTQFAWPRHSAGKICTARKSISMGLIKAPDQPDLHSRKHDSLGVYQKLPTQEEETIGKRDANVQDVTKKAKTEYKAKYKPFTSYVYIDGQWKKTSRLVKIPENPTSLSVVCHPWYSEVMERLERANEYKCRGHGYPLYGEHLPSVYTKRHDTTPVVARPKKEPPEVHLPTIPLEKSTDAKKRERPDRKMQSVDKRGEREKRPESKRPKSADPVKGRKPRSQHRPQTAPPPPIKERSPNPAPAHHAYAKKSAVKSSQVETRGKSTSRPPTSSRKQKEDTSRTGLPSDGRASRTSHHPPASSAGKVWLQAGAPERGKHSDAAVRPSTLLPPAQKSPPPPPQDKKPPNEVREKEAEVAIVKGPPTPVPLTHVQTPEEVTGVKSPEPENWTVPLDKGQKLQWTESANEPLLPQAKISLKPETVEREAKPENPDMESASAEENVLEKEKNPVSPKITTADVLDRARSRLDQFWGKNK